MIYNIYIYLIHDRIFLDIYNIIYNEIQIYIIDLEGSNRDWE